MKYVIIELCNPDAVFATNLAEFNNEYEATEYVNHMRRYHSGDSKRYYILQVQK